MTTHCRIGKIKLRGGATLHKLNTRQRPEPQSNMVAAAIEVADNHLTEEIGGFYICAWQVNGQYTTSYFISEDSAIGRGAAPSFVADCLRRRMINDGSWD